ncbi:2-amino-4-hydroxy-6-hydroxymethyldihydropteridine diphosphokinase [Pseudomonas sp. F1_0610]|uniref:2-amino-4-hydroxy-6- hydroxymethyldihydropteridine diphosphokinase n=1 Tax=Pseudomonas sp. F1_0610 TaxID=3114284 RepID=UPI0039C395DC
MATAYVGMGSNLATPEEQLIQALKALAHIPCTTLLDYSSFYSTTPVGPQDQPRFVNAVAKIETELEPLALLDALQSIELEQGRLRKAERWGPRTLDLDLLLFADQIIRHERLIVPHYQMHLRAFVLEPLIELCPTGLRLPTGVDLAELHANCPPDNDLKALYKPTLGLL